MLDTATMPVAAQTRVGRPGDPCVMVIFGAAGDLTRRKLVPALYNLARNQLLSREFAVLGIAHRSMVEEEFRKKVVEDVRQYTGNDGDPDLIEWFIRHMYYVTGEFDDKNIYPQLKNHLEKIDKEHSTHSNYFFYLATAPNFFGPIVEQLSAAGRDEQAKILHAIQPHSSEDVLSRTARGQYGDGIVDAKRVPAYRAESGVPPNSKTETFVAMKLAIDNWRWADVPFYLRTGKRLPAQNTHIVIQFRRAPFVLFRDTPVENLMPNQLVLHIQPEEGISLQFAAKVPGPVMRLGAVDMNFEYADYFGTQPSTGYERLLHDCMIGDQTLFQRADMVEAGWCVVSSVLDVWKALPPRNFPNYPAGTWGPKEAEELLERDGRHWRNFEK